MPTGVLYGAVFGTLIGLGSRLALKKTLASSDKIFYSVFIAGFLFRLAVLFGCVCMLRHEKAIIIISFTGTFVLVQTIFEAVPLRHNGNKRNS